ncbi:MAG: hypothetical protein ACRYFU_12940 [Janthinobacterium lividum]
MPERTQTLFVPELPALAFSRLFRLAPLLFFAGFASTARACTVCDSLTAHRVRAGIFNGHFLHTFSLVAAPFPLFAIAICLLHFGMPDLTLSTVLPASSPANGSASFGPSTLFAEAEPTP